MCRGSSLARAPPAGGGDHEHVVTAAQRFERGADQLVQIGVVEGALGDEDDGGRLPHLVPPVGQFGGAGVGRQDGTDVLDRIRQIAARVLEAPHAQLHQPVGQPRPVAEEHRRTRAAGPGQRPLEQALAAPHDHPVRDGVHPPVVEPGLGPPRHSERRGVGAGQRQRPHAARHDRRAGRVAEEQGQHAGEGDIAQDRIDGTATQRILQRRRLAGQRCGVDRVELGAAQPEPAHQGGNPPPEGRHDRWGVDLDVHRQRAALQTRRRHAVDEFRAGQHRDVMAQRLQTGTDGEHRHHMARERSHGNEIVRQSSSSAVTEPVGSSADVPDLSGVRRRPNGERCDVSVRDLAPQGVCPECGDARMAGRNGG